MEIQFNTDNTTLHFKEVLTIASLSSQQDLFIKALAAEKPFIIYSEKIKQVDTAGLQLLLSFFLSAEAQNLSWQWKNASSILIQKASLLGISPFLKLTIS